MRILSQSALTSLPAAFGSIYESSRMFLRSWPPILFDSDFAICDFLCSWQVQCRDVDAAISTNASIATVKSLLLPIHFSREFMCDCAAATFAAIACT
jgi:hypothetical protein